MVSNAFLFLALIGAFLLSALAVRSNNTRGIPLLLLSFAMPIPILWADPGWYGVPGYAMIIIPCHIATFAGAAAGGGTRFMIVAPSALVIISSCTAVLMLLFQ